MPSTYSPNLRIELIGTGEQSGTWGLTTNSNLGTIIESAISGYVQVITSTADQALTALNGAADQARNMIIELDTTTGAAYNVYVPNADKFYVIRNASEYPVTIYCSTVLGNTTAAGTGVTIPGATSSGTVPSAFQICTDGTNVYDALNSFAGSLIVNGNVTLGNRLSATYVKAASGSSSVVVTTTGDHGYSTGDVIQFIPTTGTPSLVVPGGDYTITVSSSNVFSFTANSAASSGSAFVTNDTITLNGVVQPGVVIASDTGTTYPALRITQVGTGAALLIEDDTNPDSSPFLISTTGQVIKGNTTALVAKNSTGTVATTFDTQVIGTSEASSGIGVFNYSNGTSTDPSLSFNKSLNNSVGDHTAVTDGTQLGVIGFAGSDAGAGSNQAFQSGAYIMGSADGNATAGSVPGRLSFATTLAGDPYPTERMRINNQGRVGINATSLTTVGFRNNQPFNSDASVSGATIRQMYLEGAITATVAGSSYSSSGLEVQTTWNQAGLAMSYGISSGGWARGIYSSPTITGSSGTVTASSAFVAEVQNTGAGTLTSAVGFNAAGVTNTGGGTLTNAFAFYVPADWTGATNNYGYYSDIPTAANRWNLYVNGTAPNYFNGNVGIGQNAPTYWFEVYAGSAGDTLNLAKFYASTSATGGSTAELGIVAASNLITLAGGTSDAIAISTNSIERVRIASTGQGTFTCADMTTSASNAFSFNVTAKATQTGTTSGAITTLNTDATYTGAGSVIGFYANQGTFTVAPTNAYGFYIASTFNEATSNYGYYSNIAAATGDWNFYANGTANNYFAGNVGIGVTVPGSKLDVQATGDVLVRVKANSSGAGGDDDAGIALDSAETGESYISFRLDGTQTAYIDNNATTGYLRLATTAASGDYISLSPVESEAVRINAAGTLLAGTVFTEYTLGGIIPPVQITGTSQNTSSLSTLVWSTTSGSEPNIILGKGYNATPGTYTAIANGQNIGQIAFAASDGTAISYGAGIVASTTGTWSGSSRPTEIEFYVVPSGTTSSTTSLVITPTGLTSEPVYNNTNGGAVNMVVTSTGLIRRSTSSIKYKKDVENLNYSLVSNAIDNLRPVWYRSKNASGDDKETWSHIGLIAEEVHTVEPRLVSYRTATVSKDENGRRVEIPLDTPEPEGVDYARLSVLLLAEMKTLRARVAALEAK